MVELVIVACLVASGACMEKRFTYDARDVSLMTCTVAGQVEVARWHQQHPSWHIKRWRCGIPRQYGQLL